MTDDLHDDFATSGDGTRVHLLDNGASGDGTPVVHVPGALAAAEAFEHELRALAPRRAIAVSLRGRGRSDAPDPSGASYGLDSCVADISACVLHAAIDHPHVIVAHSMGVPVALSYAFANPDAVAGLVLIDYPPLQPPLDPDWADDVRASMPDVPEHVLAGMVRDLSAPVILIPRLPELTCPLLVVRGEHGFIAGDDGAGLYAGARSCEVVTMPGAGHEPWNPEREGFFAHVHGFLRQVDANRSR